MVRAVAIALERPYQEIYAALSYGCKTQRRTTRGGPHSSARDGVDTHREWFKRRMREWGFTWVPCMGLGTGCQVHLADGELPAGRLVVSLSKHYTAVIDGVIYDTYDPQRPSGRCVYGYWRLT